MKQKEWLLSISLVVLNLTLLELIMIEQRDLILINTLEYLVTRVNELIDSQLYQEAESLYNEWREYFIENDIPVEVVSVPYHEYLEGGI